MINLHPIARNNNHNNHNGTLPSTRNFINQSHSTNIQHATIFRLPIIKDITQYLMQSSIINYL